MKITTIGLDLAKHVFQVHAVDEAGKPVIRRQLRRSEVLPFFEKLPPCLIGMEACGSAHHWGRKLSEFGHDVRLIPARYVKPYIKRGKSDAIDAAAICEAVTRPSMRFVPIKSAEQQSSLMLHRTRDLLVRQQTAQINALRAHLAEFGLIAAKGISKLPDLVALVEDQSNPSLPDLARRCARTILVQIENLRRNLAEIDQEIQAGHKANEASRRLAEIPGIGPITASAIVATIADPSVFRSGRDFAAWVGLVPRLSGTGGKVHLGHISKQGDQYLRRLLYLGAVSLIYAARNKITPLAGWINRLLAAKPARVVAIAVANKLARIAWTLIHSNEKFIAAKACAPAAGTPA